LYSETSSKSVFLADKLNDYFLGGLDDMAAWTQISWNKVFYMLENGTNKCDLKYNIIDLNCNNISQQPIIIKSKRKSQSKSKYFKTEKFNFVYKDADFLNVTILKNNAVLLSSTKKYEEVYKASLRKYSFVDNKSKKLSFTKSNLTYFVQNEYANLGWSLATGEFTLILAMRCHLLFKT